MYERNDSGLDVAVRLPRDGGTSRIDAACRCCAMLVLIAGSLVCLQPVVFPTTTQRHQRQIALALTDCDLRSLRRDMAQDFNSDSDHPGTIALAAQAAAFCSDDKRARELFEQLPRDGGRWEFLAAKGLARRDMIDGDFHSAERQLRRALQLNPDDLDCLERLGHLLQVEGRSWEAAPYFFAQCIRGKCRGDELLAAAAHDRFFRSDPLLENAALQHSPPEPLISLASARLRLMSGETAQAEQLFHTVLNSAPELGEAQGRYGRLVVDRGNLADFLRWRGSLPDEARAHPEVWYAQGLFARQQGKMEGAARCFLEALSLAPNHLGANVQVSACLHQLGKVDAASAFRFRSERLSELESVLNVLREDSNPKYITRIIELLDDLDRHWEAAGWAAVLCHLQVDRNSALEQMRRSLQAARGHWQQQSASDLPSHLIDRRQFSLPQWPLPSENLPVTSPSTNASVAWKFTEEARSVGIDFQYFEGTTEENRLEHIFNVMGGGLAAFDYDGDGWPDLYFAQAHQWRSPQQQPEHFDRMFRNREGERFDDITALAGLGDLLFSHGVTVGDYDQDGWPDVYLGNLGPNRLYRNNGDGTFSETADATGVAGDEWTTSSVFADFNGDSLPDLYVLNYTRKEETAQKRCGPPEKQQSCTPDVLTAEDHRCYVNLGDGRFRDVSKESGILGAPGKGLGIVSWDYANDGRIGLFVANDTTPNFFFVNQGTDPSGVPAFRNEAVVRGIAYDMDGNVQASMGVAAGDINGDGRIDIFITDFFAAANALYCQGPDGFFEDRSRAFNVHEPSLSMLGFGCQYADVDGDGWLDLIITNGHVDQKTSRGGADRMPPQIYRNLQGTRFELVPSVELGSFFQAAYLGRGLATLDWNRDGRTDFAISHLHAPAALVTNHTPNTQTPLIVRLIGRRGTREPTGATVTWVGSEPLQARLQTGGDGFLVTNEHRHQFAIPGDRNDVHLQVRWPDGHVQDFDTIPTETEVVLIEDRDEPVVLRRLSD